MILNVRLGGAEQLLTVTFGGPIIDSRSSIDLIDGLGESGSSSARSWRQPVDLDRLPAVRSCSKPLFPDHDLSASSFLLRKWQLVELSAPESSSKSSEWNSNPTEECPPDSVPEWKVLKQRVEGMKRNFFCYRLCCEWPQDLTLSQSRGLLCLA